MKQLNDRFEKALGYLFGGLLQALFDDNDDLKAAFCIVLGAIVFFILMYVFR